MASDQVFYSQSENLILNYLTNKEMHVFSCCKPICRMAPSPSI